MQFSKTIVAVAITASSAFALIGPGSEKKTICLSVQENAEGILYAGSCDESRNNKLQNLEILANGCAANQVSVSARKFPGGQYNVQVSSCLPPNVAQL